MLEIHLAQPRFELVERPVLRQHEPSAVDQRAVGAPTLPEIARVLGEDVVGEHGGDAQLVAAPYVQVQAPWIDRPRREARIEGWLTTVVVDSVRRRIDRPALGIAERRNHRRYDGDREPPA